MSFILYLIVSWSIMARLIYNKKDNLFCDEYREYFGFVWTIVVIYMFLSPIVLFLQYIRFLLGYCSNITDIEIE